MKTDIQPYYRPNAPKVPGSSLSSLKVKEAQNLSTKSGFDPDAKVQISKEAKALSTESNVDVKLPISSPDDLTSLAKKKASEDVIQKSLDKTTKLAQKAPEKLSDKPAIFFVKGFNIFGQYSGLNDLSEVVEGSRIYGWDQKSEMINEIKKHERTQPIILVGHSLGGDTAHEVAEALNSLEHEFRSVDLLITLDAYGSDHHLIPTNVKRHLNYFTEDGLFSDLPHLARNTEKTIVKNHLSQLGHTELDDNKEMQAEILQSIKDILPYR